MRMEKILVIGGSYQGKTKWVQEHYPEYKERAADEIIKQNQAGSFQEQIWVNGFQKYMKQWLVQKQEYQKNVALLLQNPSWVIVSDEVGSGIVPLEKEDREWREATGRMLCEIAKEADEVYRMYCGIAVKIKERKI